ncbi:MAG: hypothetical protein HOK80_09155 [Candidatus Cloacimonetes bacterium]|nr:hypothetical protein [Candidatus Cloacimonadota bacterium]
MLTRIFPEKHLDAIINTMNGYEAVIDAIKKGKHIEVIRNTIQGFGGRFNCSLCSSLPEPSNYGYVGSCKVCIYGPDYTGCINFDNESYEYISRFKKDTLEDPDIEYLHRIFINRLANLRKLLDEADYEIIEENEIITEDTFIENLKEEIHELEGTNYEIIVFRRFVESSIIKGDKE